MVETLGDAVAVYKIGLTLLAGEGVALSRELRAAGKQVFQDWKLHDIGAQVEGAAAAVAADPRDPANWLAYVRAARAVEPRDWNERYQLGERATAAAYMAYQRASSRPDEAAAAPVGAN